VSAGRTTLYIANSDFDLRYSGGSVLAVDLQTMRAALEVIPRAIADGTSATDACAQAALAPNASPWLNPGPCEPAPLDSWIGSASLVGAFASGMTLAYQPDGPGARLFVPVRGDPSITYFDVQDDRTPQQQAAPTFQLNCGAAPEDFCDSSHRLGQDPDRTLRGIQLPADPLGIAANAEGTALVTAHETQAAASLLVNDWAGIPWLSYFTSSLPTGPTEVAAIPEPAVIRAARALGGTGENAVEYREGFAVTFQGSAEVDVLRYYADSGSVPPRPYIVRASAYAVTTNTSNVDSRGIALVDDARRSCESSCADPLDVVCQKACAAIPLDVYMANRNPQALLIGQITTELDTKLVTDPGATAPHEVILGATDKVTFFDSVPLSYGASRIKTGKIINASGVPETRIFAVCFDARTVFVYDPKAHRVEMAIRTGRGPHAVAVDSGTRSDGDPYSYLYVGHFTDSYLGVVDLDMRRPLTYGQMFASVGTPNPPQESK